MIGTVAGRIERIHVVTAGGAVYELTPAGRDALVAQLQFHRQQVGFELEISGLDAFLRASRSGPVNLDRRDLPSVIDAINALEKRHGGADQLEPELAELKRRLMKELRAAQAEEDAHWRAEHPERLDVPWLTEGAPPRRNRAARIIVLAGLLVVAGRLANRSKWPSSD